MILTRQPQYLAPVDWGNPITRGLAFVQLGAAVFPVSKWTVGSLQSGAVVTSSPAGVGFGNTSSPNPIRTFDPVLSSSAVFSAFAVASTDPSAAATQAIFDSDGGLGSRFFQFRMNSNTLECIRFNTGGTPFFATTPAIGNEIWLSGLRAGIVCNNAEFSVFANGTKTAGTSITGTPTADDSVAWWLGNYRGAGGNPWRGSLPLVAIWDRVLSDAEFASLNANPWQIFQAPRRALFAPSAAGGDVSVALTGTAATASIGTLAPSTTVALTGEVATTGIGDVTAGNDVSVGLTGQEMTAAVGSVSPSNTVALLGSQATASPGTLVATPTFALSGQEAITGQGSVTQSRTVPLTGEGLTSSQGTMGIVGDVTVALTGQSMTVSLGDFGVEAGVVDHRRYRRQYIVRRKDELFVFDDPFEAQAFEAQGKPPLVTPLGKGPKRAPKLVKAPAAISLPAVVNDAPDWAKAKLEKMIAEAQYARLLDMVAELEEEDELELILLNL